MPPSKPKKQPARPSETLEQRLERVAIDMIERAERRKAESAAAKRVDKLTADQVLAWYRDLDPRERAGLRQELDHIDTKRSGLA